MADVPPVAAETAVVEVSLLGGFAVRVNGRLVPGRWRLRKAKTLVKLLALAEGHRVHLEVLAEWLWPGLDAAAAANNLHQALHVARRALGLTAPGCRLLELRDDVVVLCPAGGLMVDVEAFEAAAAGAIRSGDAGQLRAALQLWSGGLLPEDRYADWAAAVRDRLDEQRARVAVALSAAGHGDEVLPVLEAMAAGRPADELLHRALMTTTYAASGPAVGRAGRVREIAGHAGPGSGCGTRRRDEAPVLGPAGRGRGWQHGGAQSAGGTDEFRGQAPGAGRA